MTNLRLLNKYEEITLDKLKSSVENEAHVFAKVRLADVFSITGSGINEKEYSYCLKAHFDFVVTDKNYMPLFSVEYDGGQHRTNAKQIENDKLKDSLCEQFKHPILRINSRYIDREYKGIDLLTYFIDVWFLEEAFYDAQEKGIIPYDEPFDACSIFDGGKGNKWPYWISSEIQIELQKLYRLKKINQPAPSHWIGVDANENYRCICWVETDKENVVYVKTGMRRQLYTAVHISDLLSMLAIFDLDKKLNTHHSGLNQAVSFQEFSEILDGFCSKLKPRCSATCGSFSYPVF
jgi:hypothetical protein